MTKSVNPIQFNSVFVPDYLAPYFAERKRQKVDKPTAFLELLKIGYSDISNNRSKWDTLDRVIASSMADLKHHNDGTEVTLKNVYRSEIHKPTIDDLSWEEIRELMGELNDFFEQRGLSERISYMLTFTVNLARWGYTIYQSQIKS